MSERRTTMADGNVQKNAEESAALRKDGSSSAQTNVSPAAGIPLYRKISYAVGGMPYQMTQTAKGFFLQIFLLDVVQMGPFHASLILFVGRAWDAITDPVIGYLVSKSGRTRIGKLIPWTVFSMPPAVLSYIMMWYVPHASMSSASSLTWFLIWTCLFDLFLSCYNVPYSSLNMFLGGDQKDRDSATGYRMGVEMFAVLAGAIIQGQIVGVYHARKAQACSLINSSSPTLHNTTSSLTDSLQHIRRAYTVAAVVQSSLFFVSSLVLFLGVKEQLAPLSTLGRTQMPFLRGMNMLVRHTPYVTLVFGFLFCSLAFQMAQGNAALFFTHAVGLGPYFQHLLLVLMASATLSIPLWQMLLGRLGKKTTLFIGMSIYVPVLAVIVSVHGSLAVFIPLSITAGCSLAVLYLLPWSMLPDVVDDFKVKHPDDKDLEPMFFSCFVFFNKFGGGLAIGISTLVLHFVGYTPGACSHPAAVTSALRVLFAPVPIVLLLIGMLLFCLYPIDETRRRQIRTDLLRAVEAEEDRRVAMDLEDSTHL